MTMSAFGTWRAYRVALHMSAIGGKADMLFALQMSAFDPKRTFQIGASQRLLLAQRRRRFQLRTV